MENVFNFVPYNKEASPDKNFDYARLDNPKGSVVTLLRWVAWTLLSTQPGAPNTKLIAQDHKIDYRNTFEMSSMTVLKDQ